MFRRLVPGLILAGILAAFASHPALADDAKPKNSAVAPSDRLAQKFWKARHEKFLERTRKGGVDVVFIGDSITQGWEGAGKKAWATHFEPMKAGNYGIGGDRTGHVLWRITKGKELEGISPRAAVIMIGTNNMGSNSAEEIAAGVTAIVKELRSQKPQMKILLLGIFPRSPKAADPVRAKIKKTNETISKLEDGKMVFYKDIGDKFLGSEGQLTKEIMPDFLHLSPKGYEIWAEAIKADLEKLTR